SLRTSGVARTFSPCDNLLLGRERRGSERSTSPVLGGVPSAPMTTSTVPTGTTARSATRIFETSPPDGEGISTVVLSVAISTSGSSSAISWPSCTSQRAISPSVSPSPRSGSLNSYATSGVLPDRPVAQHGVHALHLVHDLRHVQVDDDTRKRERMIALYRVFALHQVEHRRLVLLGRLIECFVE